MARDQGRFPDDRRPGHADVSPPPGPAEHLPRPEGARAPLRRPMLLP